MIIVLTSSLLAIKSELTETQIAGIERLCSGIYRGENILTLESPEVVDYLESNAFDKLGVVSKGVLTKARSKFAYHGSLGDLGVKSIFVVDEQDAIKNRCEVTLSHLLFLDLKPTILAEHIIDAKIYMEAAHHYSLHKKTRGFTVSGKPGGGGGASIPQEFQNTLENKNLCLAIVDSDENWPNRPPTPVERKCKEIADASEGYGEAFRLPARELENMIPLKILKEIFARANGYHAVDSLEKILENDVEGWRCADIKQGIKLSTFRAMNNASPEYSFYAKYFKEAACDIFNIEAQGGSSDEFLLRSIGNCGEPFLNWLQLRSKHAAFQLFHDHWKEYWLSLGEKVFSWCCAEEVIRL